MTLSLAGTPVSAQLLDGARRAVQAGVDAGRPPPQLVSVHRDAPTPFRFYLRQQARTAALASVGFRPEPLAAGAGAGGLRDLIDRLEGDRSVHAVLVEHPLPPELDFSGAVGRLSAEKDVDGVGFASLGRLVAGRPVHVPAVALASLAILEHYGIPVAGRRVAVIGRSSTVGLPLALRLLAQGAAGNATVTIAHSKTPRLAEALAGSEVIFSCAGIPGLLDRTVVPEGATVVDVGLSSVPDPSAAGGQRAVGDADPASLDGWAAALSPVPGGVGPVTVAQLMASTVLGWERLTAGSGG